MTEIEDTAENDESNEDEMPESERHVLAAVVALDELSDSDLAGVIVGELWARRAKAQPGLLDAAYTAINAVLGAELTKHQEAMLPRLTAIGRGVVSLPVKKKEERAALIREIAQWVRKAQALRFSKPSRKARLLSEALKDRFGAPVDAAELEEAFANPSIRFAGLVAKAVLASALLDETATYAEAKGAVKSALKVDKIDDA